MASAKDKGDGLWDDSALINAFNDAISKYKKMHGLACNNNSTNLSATGHDSEDSKRHAESGEQNETASSTNTEMGNFASVSDKETPCFGPEVPETHLVSPNAQHIQCDSTGYQSAQSPKDYNQLLNKYYELEDQRQKILQQLNHFGYWNYNSGYGVATSMEQSISASQAYPTVESFCPFGCQSWITPCTSAPSCCFNEGYAGKSCHIPAGADCSKKVTSLEEIDFIKTAKVAAERALSCLKEQAPSSELYEGKDKEAEINAGHSAKSTSRGTDLSVVLNAWYSAGFYTGKYLSEQSFTKSKHG